MTNNYRHDWVLFNNFNDSNDIAEDVRLSLEADLKVSFKCMGTKARGGQEEMVYLKTNLELHKILHQVTDSWIRDKQ